MYKNTIFFKKYRISRKEKVPKIIKKLIPTLARKREKVVSGKKRKKTLKLPKKAPKQILSIETRLFKIKETLKSKRKSNAKFKNNTTST